MKLDPSGIDFIKSFEGFSAIPYKDIRGKWTIGWGHTEGVTGETAPVTESEAKDLLASDLKPVERCLNNSLSGQIAQCEYTALCSFTFNEGIGNFLQSTLLKKFNAGDKQGASKEFERWVYFTDPDTGNKIVSAGLQKRRALEKQMFLVDFNSSRNQLAG